MPLNRYLIRNEHNLADPELYEAASKDDPEALLEGVAMAGLVGLLRQMGDLAEFAAEIFHDLHEQVTATASRGHGLTVRIRRLEAETPSVQKTLLSQTHHAAFLYDPGVDWHSKVRVDENVVNRKDLPPCIMNDYEESRAPPRLFLLDKFDVAGAGACLKRYSDPSFFKIQLAYSINKNPEVQTEKKTHKIKWRGTWSRDEYTPYVVPSLHAKLQHPPLVQHRSTGFECRVPLKRRLDGFQIDEETGISYMQKFIDPCSSGREVVHEICLDHGPINIESSIASQSELNTVEIGTTSQEPSEKDKLTYSHSSVPDVVEILSVNELNVVTNGKTEEVSVENHQTDTDKILVLLSKVVHEEEESAVDSGWTSGGSIGVYHSDDIVSDTDSYVDALATMESEVETDTDFETRKELHHLNFRKPVTDSEKNKELHELQSQFFDHQSFGKSTISEGTTEADFQLEEASSFATSVADKPSVSALSQGPVCVDSKDVNSILCIKRKSQNFSLPSLPQDYGEPEEDISGMNTVSQPRQLDISVDAVTGCRYEQNISSVSSLNDGEEVDGPRVSAGTPGKDTEDLNEHIIDSQDMVESTPFVVHCESSPVLETDHHLQTLCWGETGPTGQLDVYSSDARVADFSETGDAPLSRVNGEAIRETTDDSQSVEHNSAKTGISASVYMELSPKVVDVEEIESSSTTEFIESHHSCPSTYLDMSDSALSESSDTVPNEEKDTYVSLDDKIDEEEVVYYSDATSPDPSFKHPSGSDHEPEEDKHLNIDQASRRTVGTEAVVSGAQVDGLSNAHADDPPLFSELDHSSILCPLEQREKSPPDYEDFTLSSQDEMPPLPPKQWRLGKSQHQASSIGSTGYLQNILVLAPELSQPQADNNSEIRTRNLMEPHQWNPSSSVSNTDSSQPLPEYLGALLKQPVALTLPIQDIVYDQSRQIPFNIDQRQDSQQNGVYHGFESSYPGMNLPSTVSSEYGLTIEASSATFDLSTKGDDQHILPAKEQEKAVLDDQFERNGSAILTGQETDTTSSQPGSPQSMKYDRQQQLGFIAPEDQKEWLRRTFFTVQPGSGDSKMQKKPPRPRNPLIDEVVALDKSKLRKVGESTKPRDNKPEYEAIGPVLHQLRKVGDRVWSHGEMKSEEKEQSLPPLRKVGGKVKLQGGQSAEDRDSKLQGGPSTEDRDSIMEQIRNKTFSLKPTMTIRGSIHGPQTNLKVAAILQKATTIRQAMAGDEDDSDGWSDD